MKDKLWNEEIDRVAFAMAAANGSRDAKDFRRDAACFVAGAVTFGVFTAGMHGLDADAPAREMEERRSKNEPQKVASEAGRYRGLDEPKVDAAEVQENDIKVLSLTKIAGSAY